ncbi:hypothetical protein [Desertibacillus haloalkaliphilus]|nr:hypothetical protein [Desertibacillus haloalkaliphilus]
MNKSLATWMSIALTAVVIVSLLYGQLMPLMGDMADTVEDYVERN